MQCWFLIWYCSGRIHFEGQKFQDEEDEDCGGECGSVAGPCGFGEKAPGASFVMAAFAVFITDFLILLHFLNLLSSLCCSLLYIVTQM